MVSHETDDFQVIPSRAGITVINKVKRLRLFKKFVKTMKVTEAEDLAFEKAHTHLTPRDINNIHHARELIKNVKRQKKPKLGSLEESTYHWYLESHARVSDDKQYARKLLQLIETRKSKDKQEYYNPPKGLTY